jgi:general stress protein CsbA
MNTSTPPPLQTEPQKPTSFGHQAAKASWVTVILVFVLVAFSGKTGSTRVFIELFALLLVVLGLVLGFFALFQFRRHRAKGILAPATIGIIINGLLLFIFVTNFLAGRARAQRGAGAASHFSSVTLPDSHENTHQTYQSEGLAFNFDRAYKLKTNKETGQVFLQQEYSSVMVTNFRKLVGIVETLKFQTAAMQQDFKNRSYGRLFQNDLESIDGSLRSGSLVRMEYDKPGMGRIHADVYILSDPTGVRSLKGQK